MWTIYISVLYVHFWLLRGSFMLYSSRNEFLQIGSGLVSWTYLLTMSFLDQFIFCLCRAFVHQSAATMHLPADIGELLLLDLLLSDQFISFRGHFPQQSKVILSLPWNRFLKQMCHHTSWIMRFLKSVSAVFHFRSYLTFWHGLLSVAVLHVALSMSVTDNVVISLVTSNIPPTFVPLILIVDRFSSVWQYKLCWNGSGMKQIVTHLSGLSGS